MAVPHRGEKEKIEDTKRKIRSRKSKKKDREYNDQKKGTNSDLQNITQKTKDRAAYTH
jgi:hypothetical protein